MTLDIEFIENEKELTVDFSENEQLINAEFDGVIEVRVNDEEVYNEGYEAGQKSVYDEVWDNTQDYGNLKNYHHAFAGPFWAKSGLLPPKYVIALTSGQTSAVGVFNSFAISNSEPYDMTEMCKKIDFSNAINVTDFFAHANIINVNCDISNCQNITGFFRCGMLNASYVNNVTLKISEKTTNAFEIFFGCNALRTIIFTDDSVINVEISFAQSQWLSTSSVNSIINALKDLTGETAKTITFHSTVALKLTSEQITAIANKGWNLG